MIRILFLLAFIPKLALAQPITPGEFEPELLATAIFEESNALRVKQGLVALEYDEDLKAAAFYQANRMAKEKKLRHDWPGDRKMGSPRKRIHAFGTNFKSTGENIARDYLLNIPSGKTYYLDHEGKAVTHSGQAIPFRTYQELAHKVVHDWFESPGHRENLLGDFAYLGIGVSNLVPEKKGPNFDVYLVQNFGK